MLRYLQTQVLPYVRTTILPSKPVQLFIQTGLKWDQDNCPGMAAALAYYALFSLFPLLLVILSVFGAFFSPTTATFQAVQASILRYLPPEVHELVRDTLMTLHTNSVGAGVVGFGLLFFAASTIFAVLRQSVNKIWVVPSRASESGSLWEVVVFFVVNKLTAFLLVLGTAGLLLASLIANIAIRIILELVENFQATFAFVQVDELLLTEGLQMSSSVLLLALAICLLFKILPSEPVPWRDVWLGALLTTLLLVGLQQLASNSVISIGSRFLSYGVVGSVMILMLWVFLACQIFFLGCAFSYIYAHLFGSRRHQLDRA